ncbi:ATP-binding protein [Streptomyces sp. NPDC006872]|uniref:ATP-binding protein n=1 Tax=Streptomyces sp. NPDC006872 TaxID=3155720 RepID=UPI0033EFB224
MAEGSGQAGRAGYFCISGRPKYGGTFADLELLPKEVQAVRKGLGALGLTELFADEVKAKAKANGESEEGYALTHAELCVALDGWSKRADKGEGERTATLIVYATGHGHQEDHQWMLVPPEHDDPLGPLALLLPATLIAGLKKRTDLAQVLLILDACGAGPGGEQTLLDTMEKSRYRDVDGQFDLWVVAAARRAETARQTVFSDAFTAALRDTAVRSFDQAHLDLAKVMDSVQEALSRTSQKARIVAGHEDPHCRTLPNPLFMPSEPPGGLPAGWSRSSRGVLNQEAPGWYFTGREAALRTVLDHLSGAGSAPPLWLTGSRGSGKTAVLGRIATTATADLRAGLPVVARQGVLPVGDLALAAVDARGRTADRLAAEIARRLKLTAAESVADLLAELGGGNSRSGGNGGNGGNVRGVIVDHVDEADAPDAVLADLIGPLAALPDVRVVLGAARPLPGHPADLTVDLDEPAHRGPAAVGAYLRTRQDYGAPGAPGAPGPPEVVTALERICGGCFAAAVAAADVLVRDRLDSLDRASEAAAERLDHLLRRTLGEFLPQPVADAAVDVLTALCSFHDDLFLDLPTWAAVTARSAQTPVDAAELEAGLAACRTFLERRDATVRPPGKPQRAVRAVLRQLLDEIGPDSVGFSGWERVAPHLLDILAAAAADPVGDVGRLLDDPGFLLALPRPTMTRTVKALRGPDQAARAAVWNAQPRQAEPHQRRFALALAATRRGLADLAQAVGPVAAPCGSLEVRWARPGVRERHTATRVSVAGSPGPGSVITAHDDGTLVWWDGGSGEQGPSRQIADSRIVGLHLLETADGAAALVVLADGSVLRCAPDADRAPDQVLRAGRGELPGPSAGHPAGFLALGDGPAVEVLAVGPSGGDLEQVGREPFRQTVVATALAGPPDDPVLWAATLDGVVHRWSPAAPGAPRRVALCPNPVRLAAAADGETAVIVDADGNCTFVGGAAALAGAVPALRRNLRAVELTADWFVVAGGDAAGYGQGPGGGAGGNWLDTYSVTDGSSARWPLDGLPTGIRSHGADGLVVVTSRAPALLRARTDPKHSVSQHRSSQYGMSQHGMSQFGRRR